MEGCSVDSIVTDPPYELGFMGREWDSTGVAYDVATWREAWSVLKPGGFLLAFGGARTYHRLACAIEDAGFEIRDQIMWIYGSGFPKGGNRDGLGTCLKPSHEPIVVARKPCVGSARAIVEAVGTGALNIDACRVHGEDAQGGSYTVKRVKPGATLNATGGNWRPEDGPEYRGELKPGRWPANVIHDGSDEVVSSFPIAPGQQGDLRGHATCRQSPNGIFGGMRPALDHAARGDTGSAARFFYCAKASKADRDEGLAGFDPQTFVQFQTGNGCSGKPSAWSEGRDTQYRNTHPTVKPTALMRYLVRLVTPVGGTVLDPFTGSGSTGKAAILEGRSFIGCELTEEYLPIAHARIGHAVGEMAREAEPAAQMPLFGSEAA